MLLSRTLIWMLVSCTCVQRALGQEEFNKYDNELENMYVNTSNTTQGQEQIADYDNDLENIFENTTSTTTAAPQIPDFDNDLENIFENTTSTTTAAPAKICKPDKWNSFKAKYIEELDGILIMDCNRNISRVARDIFEDAFEEIQKLIDFNDSFITATESTTATPRTTTTTAETATTTTEQPTTVTSTTTTAAPTITSTTVKPIKYCGWNNENRCIKRWNCNNQPKKEEKFQINLRENGECHYLETCCSTKNILNNTQMYRQVGSTDSQCGYANNKGVYMTIEGNDRGEADFGEFPWTVAIFTISNVYLVGGSLIAPQVVLSSANLLRNDQKLKVRAGDWDLKTEEEILPYQEILVNEIVIHQNYSFELYKNDIALLFLEESFHLMPHIRPICLPQNIPLDFDNCIVSGWNKTPRGGRLIVTNMLLRIANCTFNNDSLLCVRGSTSYLRYSTGSALMCPKAFDSTNRYYQIGTWSHGSSTNQTRFTKVLDLMDWINVELRNKIIKPSARV